MVGRVALALASVLAIAVGSWHAGGSELYNTFVNR